MEIVQSIMTENCSSGLAPDALDVCNNQVVSVQVMAAPYLESPCKESFVTLCLSKRGLFRLPGMGCKKDIHSAFPQIGKSDLTDVGKWFTDICKSLHLSLPINGLPISEIRFSDICNNVAIYGMLWCVLRHKNVINTSTMFSTNTDSIARDTTWNHINSLAPEWNFR